MGEQPIFTCKAHVFHIDPSTKRSWLPASTTAVPVSFFYDSSRGLYRIISVEGTKAVINSTVTPSMTFTKTSQKFGQWSDVRANTVYGLGFPSEAELNKFIEQFQEVKEATRIASGKPSIPISNGSQQQPIPPPNSMGGASPMAGGRQGHNDEDNVTITNSNDANANSILKNQIAHQRSQSLSLGVVSGVSPSNTDSPKHTGLVPGKDKMSSQSIETQLKYENERLRQALAQSSANAKKWEIELATLKSNNSKLTAALQESTANVEEWKKQLNAYKEENQRMKIRTLEAEAARGNSEAATELRKEVGNMREKLEGCFAQLKIKEDEIKNIKEKGAAGDIGKDNNVAMIQAQLDTALGTQESQRRALDELTSQLAEKIQDLIGIHRELNTTLQT